MSDAQQRGQANQPPADARIQPLVEQVRGAEHPLTGDWSDFDPLMKLIDDARYVLIGEASHGTHEFYRARAHHPAADRGAGLHRRLRRGGLA
ncbi:MAG TPA: hypothetical protein VFQ32_03350, partial [Ktedonobacterales bacterium]|nr:hypothetical protein [Ktedonobacterales bacterium]